MVDPIMADAPCTSDEKLEELIKLCKEMLNSDCGDDTGKPTWGSIYAIEDKLKDWGYIA